MFSTICYISKGSNILDKKKINSLFEQVSTFNNSNNIKGILLFNNNYFFQILEGETEIINTLFHNNIKLDPRHNDVFVAIEMEFKNSVFSEYNSKFNIVKDAKDLKKIISYLDLNKFSSTNEKLKRLLQPFLILMED